MSDRSRESSPGKSSDRECNFSSKFFFSFTFARPKFCALSYPFLGLPRELQ